MTTSPGWYDDPENASGQRYWDGQAWTPHRQQKPVAQQAAPPPPAPPQQAAWQTPGYPPAGPPQRSSNPAVIIGVIVGVIVLGAGGWFGYQHWFNKAKSPEDQIRNVVQREMDNFNASNFAHDPAIECKSNGASDEKHEKEGPSILAKAGKTSASVANIHVTGDSATADVTLSFSKVPGRNPVVHYQFVKEDGSWKECTPDSANDDDQSDDDSGN